MSGISVSLWLRLKMVYILSDEIYDLVNSWIDDSDPTRFITQWEQRFFLRRLVERSFREMEGGHGFNTVAPHIRLEGGLVETSKVILDCVDLINPAIAPHTRSRTERQKCRQILEYLGNEVPTYEPNNGLTGFTRNSQRRLVDAEDDDLPEGDWLELQYDWVCICPCHHIVGVACICPSYCDHKLVLEG